MGFATQALRDGVVSPEIVPIWPKISLSRGREGLCLGPNPQAVMCSVLRAGIISSMSGELLVALVFSA